VSRGSKPLHESNQARSINARARDAADGDVSGAVGRGDSRNPSKRDSVRRGGEAAGIRIEHRRRLLTRWGKSRGDGPADPPEEPPGVRSSSRIACGAVQLGTRAVNPARTPTRLFALRARRPQLAVE